MSGIERGKYIVIEGNDGTGKSTQVELLVTRLLEDYGIESFVTHEPAGTPMADAIRTVIGSMLSVNCRWVSGY